LPARAVSVEQAGLRQKDLAAILQSRSRASKTLNRHRLLTLEQAWKLHREWKIPAEILIRPYALRPRAPTLRLAREMD
jgi:HTH-type transcriptional regulator/antitoxin HigA